ncbi:MAG: acyltransferase, partial [Bacteroidales bacterium]
IDQAIHANYHIFPHNYVALDYINGNSNLDIHYTDQQKDDFYAYVEKQIEKIDIPDKDIAYLTHKIMEMYANPLKNYITAKSLN